MVSQAELDDAYRDVRQICQQEWRSPAAGIAIGRMAELALRFLSDEAEEIELSSSVDGKRYMSFCRNGVVARAVNRDLFEFNADKVRTFWCSPQEQRRTVELARLAYTTALAPCLTMELRNRNNKKGPATYFEYLVGHIFARLLHSEPTRNATVSVLDQQIPMTMDFLFETATDVPNIHLPIKMSTRERIVQAWAHQRILDTAFGSGHYRGIMVCFSETKLNSRTCDVEEICVPNQWLIYQNLIAKLHCIYYFDMPLRYQVLTKTYPDTIQIKPISDLLSGTNAIASH